MQKTITAVGLVLLALSSAKAQVPYISTYSTFGRDTASGFVADSYNAYNTASGTINLNSNRPGATATGSSIYNNAPFAGAQVEAIASAIGGGFYVAKNYAKLTVTNVQDSGYIAAGVYGTHTQLKFLTAPDNVAYSVFRWNVSGSTSTSPDTGFASGVLRFMAGYYPTQTYNSVFNTPTPPSGLQFFDNAGSFTYNLPITLGQNIDLFYQATASVQLSRTDAQDLLGDSYTAEADFSSTTILDQIDLYDSNNNRITSNWSLGDAATGQALFDQNGRITGGAVPEPGALALAVLGGGVGLVLRRKK